MKHATGSHCSRLASYIVSLVKTRGCFDDATRLVTTFFCVNVDDWRPETRKSVVRYWVGWVAKDSQQKNWLAEAEIW